MDFQPHNIPFFDKASLCLFWTLPLPHCIVLIRMKIKVPFFLLASIWAYDPAKGNQYPSRTLNLEQSNVRMEKHG